MATVVLLYDSTTGTVLYVPGGTVKCMVPLMNDLQYSMNVVYTVVLYCTVLYLPARPDTEPAGCRPFYCNSENLKKNCTIKYW